jgi:hypothetical protein
MSLGVVWLDHMADLFFVFLRRLHTKGRPRMGETREGKKIKNSNVVDVVTVQE